MSKGTSSFGKHSGKQGHLMCRRCGRRSFHPNHAACSSCGFGKSSKIRRYMFHRLK